MQPQTSSTGCGQSLGVLAGGIEIPSLRKLDLVVCWLSAIVAKDVFNHHGWVVAFIPFCGCRAASAIMA